MFEIWMGVFGMTLALELPLAAALAPRGMGRRAVLAAAVGTGVSHPLLSFLWMPYSSAAGLGVLGLVVGELMVIGTEGFGFALAGFPWRRALKLAAVVNVYSWWTGEFMNNVLLPSYLKEFIRSLG